MYKIIFLLPFVYKFHRFTYEIHGLVHKVRCDCVNLIIPWMSSYFDFPRPLPPGQDHLKKFPIPGPEGLAFPIGVPGGGGGGRGSNSYN